MDPHLLTKQALRKDGSITSKNCMKADTSRQTHTQILEPRTTKKTEPLPLLEEVEKVLNKIKKNKSPGQDEIPIELLTAAGNSTTILHRLCVLIWKTEKWPEDWSKTIYVPLPKNGDILSCENYRTIALASHARKILLAIILERMRQNIEEEIAKEQAALVNYLVSKILGKIQGIEMLVDLENLGTR